MVKSTINLNFNYGYKWFERGNVQAKGWVIDDNGNAFEDDTLADYFANVDTIEGFEHHIGQITGHFLVIINTLEGLMFASDRCRSFPLFYSTEFNSICLSDRSSIKENLDFDTDSVVEYLTVGYVTGKNTLFKNVFQIELGEITSFSNLDFFSKPYYSYLTEKFTDISSIELANAFEQILDTVFVNLISALNGRTVVIPLSGGYDSRLIAAMFCRHGYCNVICYSFGKKGNPEMIISKKVALALGYPWYFFETTKNEVKGFAETEEFEMYVDFAANSSAFYIIQDYFAVRSMCRDKIIPLDSVFMPGHSGDTLGGSSFLDVINGDEDKEAVIDKILKYKYNLSPLSDSQKSNFKDKISKQLANFNGNNALWYDWWKLKESHPKMFVNAVRVYEFFGYKYFLPLWDKSIVAFFKEIPIEYKKDKRFYDKVLEERVFEPLNINFNRNSKTKKCSFWLISFQYIKGAVKLLLPKSISYRYFESDVINGKVYSAELKQSMKRKGIRLSFIGTNSVKAQWYIRYLESKKNNKVKDNSSS